MAQTITNQASIGFQYNGQAGTAVSNIATAVLAGPLYLFKKSIEETYQAGDTLSFSVSFVNNGVADLTNVNITDDLGTYAVTGGNVTPLTFIGQGLLYVNGVYEGPIIPTPGIGSVTFTVPSLEVGANALILYQARVNDDAPLAVSSEITNTVTVLATGLNNPVTASNTVTVAEYADVSITKSMTPSTTADGSTMTYNFTIYNYGNTDATNVVLTDAFSPAPTNITVQVDGETVAPGNYTYVGGVLTLPTGAGYSITVPAATITQNPTTGIVTVVPSTLDITVTGTL